MESALNHLESTMCATATPLQAWERWVAGKFAVSHGILMATVATFVANILHQAPGPHPVILWRFCFKAPFFHSPRSVQPSPTKRAGSCSGCPPNVCLPSSSIHNGRFVVATAIAVPRCLTLRERVAVHAASHRLAGAR